MKLEEVRGEVSSKRNENGVRYIGIVVWYGFRLCKPEEGKQKHFQRKFVNKNTKTLKQLVSIDEYCIKACRKWCFANRTQLIEMTD